MVAVTGQIVDVVSGSIFPGCVQFENGYITDIFRDESITTRRLITPGLINAHVHIESAKMSPSAFGIASIRNGVLASVSDPHEIANVCGEKGMYWMLEDARFSPIETIFGVPPCVPAAGPMFETGGAIFDADIVSRHLRSGNFPYLAEVMNYPGVVCGDESLRRMLATALELNLPIDGHAPGLSGDDLRKYVASGITTDHECFTLQEGLEKISLGQKIIMREGSAAKNLDVLMPLLRSHPEQVMFCTDDSEPFDLKHGQILEHVRRSIGAGYDPMAVFRAACLNPHKHYGFKLGLLQKGDPADFVVFSDQKDLIPQEVYRNGKRVVKDGIVDWNFTPPEPINNFNAEPISSSDLEVLSHSNRAVRVIRAIPGQLITESEEHILEAKNGKIQCDVAKDIIKIVVLNRYDRGAKPQVAYVRGLGLKHGAVASSVAHDSHNIIAVGVNDEEIAEAINLLIASKGGQSLVHGRGARVEPLNVAGLMSNQHPDEIIKGFTTLESEAKQLGSSVPSIYMALSFLALLVIPKLKISDKVGLFDVEEFKPVSLFQ